MLHVCSSYAQCHCLIRHRHSCSVCKLHCTGRSEISSKSEMLQIQHFATSLLPNCHQSTCNLDHIQAFHVKAVTVPELQHPLPLYLASITPLAGSWQSSLRAASSPSLLHCSNPVSNITARSCCEPERLQQPSMSTCTGSLAVICHMRTCPAALAHRCRDNAACMQVDRWAHMVCSS